MPAWREPNGPLNYRQVEELIAWLTASQDVVFEYDPAPTARPPRRRRRRARSRWPAGATRTASRRPGATPPPPAGATRAASSAARHPRQPRRRPSLRHRGAHRGGTADAPRVIKLDRTADLHFTDEAGNAVSEHPGRRGRDGPVRGRQHRRLRAQLLHRHARRAGRPQRHDGRGHPGLDRQASRRSPGRPAATGCSSPAPCRATTRRCTAPSWCRARRGGDVAERATPARRPASPRGLRPARRRRLDVGRAQGHLLVPLHHLHARLHPQPGLLLHGQQHGRGGLQLRLDRQLVPGGQRGPALPGAGRGDAALADQPAGAGAAGCALGRRQSSSRGPTCTSSAAASTARPRPRSWSPRP